MSKDTVLIDGSSGKQGLQQAAGILRQGGLVVFPTETVYGLGADATNPQAVASIFTAKGRPQDNPLIVHVARGDWETLSQVAREIPDIALVLFRQFSPGPLTVVLRRGEKIAPQVSAGLDTVAVRVPAHPVARKLIELAGMPIAAPSANLSGRPSPTTFAMTKNELMGRVDVIIDGGDCEHGLESTVVIAHENKIHILRPGAITAEMLREATGMEVVEPIGHFDYVPPVEQEKVKKEESSEKIIFTRTAGIPSISENLVPPPPPPPTPPTDMVTEEKCEEQDVVVSPGVKYEHYKPNAEVYMAKKIDERVVARWLKSFAGKKVGVIRFQESDFGVFKIPTVEEERRLLARSEAEQQRLEKLARNLGGDFRQKSFLSYGEYARQLYKTMYEMEQAGVEVMIAEEVDSLGLGAAIMNRLKKASGGKWLD